MRKPRGTNSTITTAIFTLRRQVAQELFDERQQQLHDARLAAQRGDIATARELIDKWDLR